MDPEANLQEQLNLANCIQSSIDRGQPVIDGEAHRLAELVLALHEWITKGGFLPAQWQDPKGRL